MTGRFADRVALVTGGAQGIGAGVAMRLASEGAAVAIADLSLERSERAADKIREAGGRVELFPVDVSSPAQIEEMVARVEKFLGTPTIVVTCAGIIASNPFLLLSQDCWDRTMNVNLRGTFFTMQAVARRIVAAGVKGSMVGISSDAGRGGRPNNVDYAASKAGVISVVRSAALALAPYGITINAICPGVVDTPMNLRLHEGRSKITGLSPEESMATILSQVPLGRIETVDDVANATLFLLSDEASYITGQALNVDGGLEFD